MRCLKTLGLSLFAAQLAAGSAFAAVALAPCVPAYHGACGSITRALDPAGVVPGTVNIGFELYAHTNAGPAAGTIIAQEGGPGYATTGSRDGYVRMLAPLRTDHDILLIDKRGTGRSGAIVCPRLQSGRGPLARAVRDCGSKLGNTAWLYSTTYAADDVAAVLVALNTGPIDYYGDSYGTFFGQVFAVRHPDMLRSMVLDSAYPVRGESRWFPSEIANGSVALNKVCARTPACAALGSDAPTRLAALLASLRAKPVSGIAPGANGNPLQVTADAGALFLIFATAGNTLIGYRDLDAAGRAYLDAGDAAPLLRLVAEAADSSSALGSATEFSNGLATAVTCADYDYNQLYDMRAPVKTRRIQYPLAVAAMQAKFPALYAPFTIAEALGAPTDPQQLDMCVEWPAAPAYATPGAPVAAHVAFPKLPVLVLNGELDTVTSPKEGAMTTKLFPNAYFVVVRNTGHEAAIGDGGAFVPPQGEDLAGCGGPIVRNFISSGGNPGDTSCALYVRPIRAVATFAQSWAQVAPATASFGNAVGADGLAIAATVAETVGDALARYYVTTSGSGAGLRGGNFALIATKIGYRINLKSLRWTNDVSVSGDVMWDQTTGEILAPVSFNAGTHTGMITLHWNDRKALAQMSLTGSVDGQTLAASRIAP